MQLNLSLTRLYRILDLKKVYLIYIPLAIYWITIFVFTTIPVNTLPKIFDVQDKLEHFIAFFILSIFLFLALHFQNKNIFIKKNVVIVTILCVLIYGAIDEIHQMLIPGRTADIFDWIADSLGGSIGIFCTFLFIRMAKPRLG
jgi:VanZ family protein